jgi:transposase-like protein/transposase
MNNYLHPEARTTPKVRAEIKVSKLSQLQLAKKYGVSRPTICKWQNREQPHDLSHRPHELNTTLTPAQEEIVVEIRKTLLLPLDDLLVVTRQFINPAASRSAIDRLLSRFGISNLKKLIALQQAVNESEKPVDKKTFKDYEPGFLHIDIKYLPKMPDEEKHRYLFVAIDRATRWVFLRIYEDQTQESSVDFLENVTKNCPVKIQKIVTDNGTQFTDRFTSKEKKPSGQHEFDQTCAQHSIEHRLAPPRHPQTNGMVERFNGRINEVVKQTRFGSSAELEATLMSYLVIYNHYIPQRSLKHQTPIQALNKWYEIKPEIFVKTVYDHAGLDSFGFHYTSMIFE